MDIPKHIIHDISAELTRSCSAPPDVHVAHHPLHWSMRAVWWTSSSQGWRQNLCQNSQKCGPRTESNQLTTPSSLPYPLPSPTLYARQRLHQLASPLKTSIYTTSLQAYTLPHCKHIHYLITSIYTTSLQSYILPHCNHIHYLITWQLPSPAVSRRERASSPSSHRGIRVMLQLRPNPLLQPTNPLSWEKSNTCFTSYVPVISNSELNTHKDIQWGK